MADNVKVPLPYCNWKKFMQLGSEFTTENKALATRYSAYIASRATADRICSPDKSEEGLAPDVDLQDTQLLTCDELRRLITFRIVKQCFGPKSSSAVSIAQKCNIDAALLSRMKKSVGDSELSEKIVKDGSSRLVIPNTIRPFAFPVQSIPGAADCIFHVSCHNLFFGEECPTYLPDHYSAVARHLEGLSPDSKNRILSSARALKKDAIEYYSVSKNLKDPRPDYLSNYANFRDPGTILQERLSELDCEVPTIAQRFPLFAVSTHVSSKFYRPLVAQRTGIRQGGNKANVKEADSPCITNLDQILFWILEANANPVFLPKSADFFIANDYIRVDGGVSDIPLPTAPVIMYKKNPHTNPEQRPQYKPEDYEQLTNIDTLRILSFCVALPEKQKRSLIEAIFAPENN